MSTGIKAKLQAKDAHSEAPLLLTAKVVAGLLNIGESTFWRLHSAGKVPMPVTIGRSIRWRAAEIQAWVEAGCFPREQWDLHVEQSR